MCARLIAVCLISVAAACGGKGPTTPAGPQFPAVAGSYAGTTTVVFPELDVTITCPTTTTVTQTNANLSIAPFVLTGACGTLSVPIGAVKIDSNGSLEGGSGNYTDPSCGVYNYVASGGFFGRELRMSVVATSSTCFNFNMTITLTR